MRILCVWGDCGPAWVRTGWARVFAALGHEFVFWKPSLPREKGGESAFDVFRRVDPDIFIGTTGDLDRAAIDCLVSRRERTRVALVASARGPILGRMRERAREKGVDDRREWPIDRASPSEIGLVSLLVEKTGGLRPDFVFSHVPDSRVEEVLGDWRKSGTRPVGLLNAADAFVYPGASFRKELARDVSFVGGWWPYKARNLSRWILPLCRGGRAGFDDLRLGLWGNQAWPVAEWLGPIAEEDARDVFASATICPNVGEPHSTEFGYDLVERLFKVPAAGGFVVSDKTEAIDEVFGKNTIPTYGTPEEFFEGLRFFLKNPEERLPFMEKARRVVLEEHVYHRRVEKMLREFGLEKEADDCLALYRRTVSPLLENPEGGTES